MAKLQGSRGILRRRPVNKLVDLPQAILTEEWPEHVARDTPKPRHARGNATFLQQNSLIPIYAVAVQQAVTVIACAKLFQVMRESVNESTCEPTFPKSVVSSRLRIEVDDPVHVQCCTPAKLLQSLSNTCHGSLTKFQFT